MTSMTFIQAKMSLDLATRISRAEAQATTNITQTLNKEHKPRVRRPEPQSPRRRT